MEHAPGCLEDCLQDEPAFCMVACPFGLDVRDFIEKLQRGAFQAAYKAYQNAVGFPGLVSALCPEPCKESCLRGACGGAIELRLLEQASLAFARNTEATSYNVPPKPWKVAIIGAGPSGLACALRLAEKNYAVTVYEKGPRIGGHLHGLMASELLLAEFSRAFAHAPFDLRLNREITDLEALECDALYVATGAGGEAFGLAQNREGAFASHCPGAFLGGSLTGAGSMDALAQGLRACGAIEHFLKSGGMKPAEDPPRTRLKMDPGRFASTQALRPSGEGYSKEEAQLEARRCLRCACDACLRACDLMDYFRKSPTRIAEEVHLSVHPGTLDGNGTLATRLMSTCSQCGLCREVCPQDIDMGEILLQGHRAMREKGAMPWAWHDFFLRDMASANGEAGLSRLPSGCVRSRYLFFPGCQLGASNPRCVTESYRFLREHWPDTALHLGCCGAPAEWAGDEPLRNETMTRFGEAWESLGRPVVVFACPSCKQMFERHLPEIPGVFLYDLLLEKGAMAEGAPGETASVFDPCASREEPQLQQTVRTLAQRAGFRLEPLPMEGRLAQCCSWGGQVSVAHPPFARHMVKARISAGAHPYITYCINCRDIFASAGKRAWHILDIIFGLEGPDRLPPTVTECRRNRMRLKRQVLETFWQETDELKELDDPQEAPMELHIAPELRQKLSAALLLETDIAAVIEASERSGRKVFDPTRNSFSGHLLIGHMTYWAEYRAVPGPGASFELLNAYGHRMSIEEG